ncbi:tetratricopeptide repeat protein [bacterium]|nr:tetratricopeptide repeat protein [bacterium]
MLFTSLFLLAFSPFEKEASESVEGRKKYAVGEMAEAENEFSKAAKRLENNAEAYYDLGNALQSQQKYEEALEAYKKSLESGNATQKLRADIFHNMGNSFAGLGKYQDAEKFYIRSLEEEPSKDTAENLEIVRRIIAQQKEQEQQQQNQDQQKNEDQEKQDNQEQNENPDNEQKNEQNQQSAEQNDENGESNDDEQSSSENDDDGETQDEENSSASAEEQDDEQASDDKAKESSVLKQFKQRKNLQISPFMLKKEQKSDNSQTW